MLSNEGNNLYVLIRLLFPSLTKKEKSIANLILEKHEALSEYTMAEFAKVAKCSEITIIRFCKRLGMNGFAELKKKIEDVSISSYDFGRYRIKKNDSLDEIFKKIIWYFIQTLNDTVSLYDMDAYNRAYKAICGAKSIHFFGVGDANAMCQSAQVKFLRIGIPCTAHSDLACMLSTACMLGPTDVAIAVSFSGETNSVNECMRIAKENGAITIGIVHYKETTLSKYSDIELHTITIDQSDAHEEIARRIAERAIIETLYMKLVVDNRDRFLEQAQKSIVAIISNK